MQKPDLAKLFHENHLFEKTITIERNEFLTSQGKIDNNIYYIADGSLRIFIAENEEERNTRFGYKGNLITCLDSYLTGNPTSFYIQAIKKSELHLISKSALTSFLSQNPEWMKLWIEILEDLVLQQIEREMDLLIQSPKVRYLRVLKRSPRLFQEIPHKYIANYLRMTPETLSRLKKS